MRVRVGNVLAAALFVAALSLAILPVHTQAQQTSNNGNGFRISPVRYEVDMSKGETKVYQLIIENPTKSPIEAQVLINDFEASDQENGEPKILFDGSAVTGGNSFKSITSAPDTITIGASSRVTLPVTIKTEANTNPGGYYGAVRVVPKNEDQQNVSLAASVGTIFLVRVDGQLTESLELVEFTASKEGSNGRFFVNASKLQILTRLKNTGNIHVKPFGTVTVTSQGGKTVETFEFNNTDPKANVLPNQTRKFTNDLTNQKWFGKYTVTANLGYGTGGNLITAKTTFWVIPAWMLFVGIALIIALVVAGYLIYRKLSTNGKHKVKSRR